MISQVAILLLRRAPVRAAPSLLSCFLAARNTETPSALTPWQQLSGIVNEKSLLDLTEENGRGRVATNQPATPLQSLPLSLLLLLFFFCDGSLLRLVLAESLD